jgi:hypothetical protein
MQLAKHDMRSWMERAIQGSSPRLHIYIICGTDMHYDNDRSHKMLRRIFIPIDIIFPFWRPSCTTAQHGHIPSPTTFVVASQLKISRARTCVQLQSSCDQRFTKGLVVMAEETQDWAKKGKRTQRTVVMGAAAALPLKKAATAPTTTTAGCSQHRVGNRWAKKRPDVTAFRTVEERLRAENKSIKARLEKHIEGAKEQLKQAQA